MITILYSCAECGLTDIECRVRDRPANEEVYHYMSDAVIPAALNHHNILAPLCYTREFKHIKIPLSSGEDSWLGKQTDNIPPKGREA